MFRVTALVFLIVFLATPSFSQTDLIGAYADAAGTDCNIVDGAGYFMTVYIVHTSTVGATASGFRAPAPACFSGTWLNDSFVFPVHVGDSQNGAQISYGSCQTGSFHILTINYYAPGVTPDCCPYTVLPYDGTLPPVVEVADCSSVTRPGVGVTSQINKTAACDCCPSGTISVPPYPNIQVAIDAACPGDTVVLADTTHAGAGNRDIIINKPITIRSASGNPALCTVNCQGSAGDPHGGFVLGVETGTVSFEGITLTGAKGSGAYGIKYSEVGGIRISLNLKDCRLTDNGAGLLAGFCDASISHCQFDNNETQALNFQYDGIIVVDSCELWNNNYAIYTQEGTSLLVNSSSITENGTGVYVEDRGVLVIANCEISGSTYSGVNVGVDNGSISGSRITSNGGWGVAVCGALLDISATVIAGNTDGALYSYCGGDQPVTLTDCTLYGNSGTIIDGVADGPAIAPYIGISRCIIAFNPSSQTMDPPDTLQVECTDIYGNASGDWVAALAPFENTDGNISENPDFCDAPNGNFEIGDQSPCLAACGTMGAYGVGCASCVPGTKYVPPYPNIQAAIDDACPGDTIVLGNGVHYGPGNRDLVIAGKGITLRSASCDPSTCTIAAQGSSIEPHWGVKIEDTGGETVRIEGIRIEKSHHASWGPIHGAGIPTDRVMLVVRDCWLVQNDDPMEVENTDLYVENTRFEDNVGAGMFIGWESDATIVGCDFTHNNGHGLEVGYGDTVIVNNSTSSGNAENGIMTHQAESLYVHNTDIFDNRENGIKIEMSTVLLDSCTVRENDGRGIYGEHCTSVVENTVIANNLVGAFFYLTSTYAELSGCTIYGNSGTVMKCADGISCSVDMDHTIIASNPAATTVDLCIIGSVACCDVWGNAGGDWVGNLAPFAGNYGNISSDPLFCDAAEADFHLEPGSPCEAACGLMGAQDVGCDGTAVETPKAPSRFALRQNFPNPFNPSTTVCFDVPAGGGFITLKIYDVSGRFVRTLVDSRQTPGEKTVSWDGRSDGGRDVASGVYFYRLTAPGFCETRKMVLIR